MSVTTALAPSGERATPYGEVNKEDVPMPSEEPATVVTILVNRSTLLTFLFKWSATKITVPFDDTATPLGDWNLPDVPTPSLEPDIPFGLPATVVTARESTTSLRID
jgi:hypothetical protein